MPLREGVPLHGSYDDIEIILQTMTPPGTEDTSGGLAADRAREALSNIQKVTVEFASEFRERMKTIVSPYNGARSVAVEFGLSATYEGSVVFASAGVAASFKVTLTYTADSKKKHNG